MLSAADRANVKNPPTSQTPAAITYLRAGRAIWNRPVAIAGNVMATTPIARGGTSAQPTGSVAPSRPVA